MFRRTILLAVCVTSVSDMQLPADERNSTVPTSISIEHCKVHFHEVADVPATVSGRLIRIEIVEGQKVQTGARLAQVDDSKVRMDLSLAVLRHKQEQKRAQNDVNVRFAKAAAAVAESLYRRMKAAHARDAVTDADVEEAALEYRKSVLSVEQALTTQSDAGMTADLRAAEVEAVEALRRRHTILAPFSGVVIHREKRRGEWVKPGDTVARIANMEELRVEGFVSASIASPTEMMRKSVQVTVMLERGRRESFAGTVILVSPEVQPGGNYRVRALVKNRAADEAWLLRPGMKAAMQIHLKGETDGEFGIR